MKDDQEIWVMQQAIDFLNRLFLYDASKAEKREMLLFASKEVRELGEVFYPAPEERKG